MIDVKFYRFNKRRNSTAIPSNSNLAVTKSCLLRSPTSVINPVIVVEASGSLVQPENFDSYNYVEIPEFNRYYFVDNITYDNNTWVFSLTVDVLGSFRTDIRASSQFVTRTSTSAYINSNYIDTTYSTLPGTFVVNEWNPSDNVRGKISTSDSISSSTPYYFGIFPSNPTKLYGKYVLGIVGQDGEGLKYYLCDTNTAFKSLINKILTISVSMSTGSGSLSANLSRAVFDPIQYVKLCRWYPDVPLGYGYESVCTQVSSIYVGSQEITLQTGDNYRVYSFEPTNTGINYIVLDIPKSPYNTASNHRDYLNLKPYAELNLFMPMFGNIPLDTTKLFNAQKLGIRWTTDFTTGNCVLELFEHQGGVIDPFENDNVFYTANGSIGVDIPLYNLSLDIQTATYTAVAGWLENKAFDSRETIGSKMNAKLQDAIDKTRKDSPIYNAYLNIVEKLRGEKIGTPIDSSIPTKVHEVFGDTLDLYASALGQVHSSGNPSSYLSFRSPLLPKIIGYFYNQSDENLTKFGAPCNQTIAQLSSLSGFTVCANSNIDFTLHTIDNKTNPTITEREAVINFMDGGFYLE